MERLEKTSKQEAKTSPIWCEGNIAMPLTAKDFKIEKCACSVCGRPESVYSRDGHNYLRCMWEDCRLNKNMVPISAERFFEFVEKMESRYVKER